MSCHNKHKIPLCASLPDIRTHSQSWGGDRTSNPRFREAVLHFAWLWPPPECLRCFLRGAFSPRSVSRWCVTAALGLSSQMFPDVRRWVYLGLLSCWPHRFWRAQADVLQREYRPWGQELESERGKNGENITCPRALIGHDKGSALGVALTHVNGFIHAKDWQHASIVLIGRPAAVVLRRYWSIWNAFVLCRERERWDPGNYTLLRQNTDSFL